MYPTYALMGSGLTYPVTHAYAAQSLDGSTLTTYTFSSTALGALGTRNRQVVVVVSGREAATGRSVSSMTIDGVSALLVSGAAVSAEASENIRVEMWVASTNSNTSGTISVTWSGSMYWCHIGVWAIYDADTSAYDTDTDTVGSASLSLNIPANGVCIAAGAGGGGGGSDSVAFGNLTERYDSYNGTEDCVVVGGSKEYASAQTPLSETITLTGSVSDAGYVAASWGPR